MNTTNIKQHMARLTKGYRLWCIPLLMAMWQIGFKTGTSSTPDNITQSLLNPPFIAVALWSVILSICMDRRGKLALVLLTDTSQPELIKYSLAKHSFFALLLIFTPAVYFTAKAMWIYSMTGGLNITILADINILICLLAVYDGIKAIKSNKMIIQELEI